MNRVFQLLRENEYHSKNVKISGLAVIVAIVFIGIFSISALFVAPDVLQAGLEAVGRVAPSN